MEAVISTFCAIVILIYSLSLSCYFVIDIAHYPIKMEYVVCRFDGPRPWHTGLSREPGACPFRCETNQKSKIQRSIILACRLEL